MNLILLRHGESQWNKLNKFTGWTDVDLTENGISEANWSGKQILKEKLKIVSVYFRCLIFRFYLLKMPFFQNQACLVASPRPLFCTCLWEYR